MVNFRARVRFRVQSVWLASRLLGVGKGLGLGRQCRSWGTGIWEQQQCDIRAAGACKVGGVSDELEHESSPTE